MPRSQYVESIRSRIGHDLLLLPGVTAVIWDGERFLLARHERSELWSLIGGAVEPGEEPGDAVLREVMEETGARIRTRGIVGVCGGEPMMTEYSNGDRVGYMTTAYECELLSNAEPDMEELSELAWFERSQVEALPRRTWIDRVIADAPRQEYMAGGVGC